MIEINTSVIIKSLNESHDKEGSLICYGLAEFCYRGKDGLVVDEIPYRCKGTPALDIRSSGEYSQGIANGYIDLQTSERDTYKEKVASLVIRGFMGIGKPLQEVVQPEKVETPDFAQEILNEDDEELSDTAPF